MTDQYFNRWLRLIAIFYLAVGLIFGFQSEIFAMENGDTPKNISFRLVIDGLVVGEFTDLGGIGSETDVIEQTVILNGIEVIRKIPGITGLREITLKKGISADLQLWQWRQEVVNGNIQAARKDFSIILIDFDFQTIIAQWDFINGWPNKISYNGSVEDSQNYAVEGLTLVFDDSSLNTSIDRCPNDPNKTDPGVCGCGQLDTDSDNDGIPDCNDGCPGDPNKTEPSICGCGIADTDSDVDGTPDCNDGCPDDPNKIMPGICGCAVPETDSDGDGTPNCIDNCFNTDPGEIVNETGCSIADICPCDSQWKNHGVYVRCVAHTSEDFVAAGLITDAEKDIIVSYSAKSNCGQNK